MGHPITANDVRILADVEPEQRITFDYGLYTDTLPARAAWPQLQHKLYHRTGYNRPPKAVYLAA